VLLMSAAFVQPASGQSLSKQFEVTSQSYLGYVQLDASYNASSAAVVGTNLTVSATVSVENLTGSELYVRDYVMLATLLCNDRSVNASAGSPLPTQRYLYQGASWGPFNVSIPLTEANTGLSPGQAANATLTLSLITDIYYDSPGDSPVGYSYSGYTPLFGDGITIVQVQDPGGQQAVTAASTGPSVPLLPSILVGTGVLLLLVRVTVFRKRRDGEA
jgi:hypothetical protein